jgi:DNA-binding IclR family transcriptional regulator
VINSVLKAIDILSLFTPTAPRLSLTEISASLELPKSTAHNLLNTLLSRGFIEKTSDDRYALGKAVVALTQAVRVNVELRDRAAPLIRELADVCRESVYLTVRDGDCCLYIYAVESPRRLMARTAIGERVELHCTALGKAILSQLDPSESRAIIDRVCAQAHTPTTLTDKDRLCEELAHTRQRGYALDVEEHEPGTFCVGAPILDHSGQVIGACSISGPDAEIVTTRCPEFASRVLFTAQEISRRMGYVPPRISRVALPMATGAEARS